MSALNPWTGPQWKTATKTQKKARAKRNRRLKRSERAEKADVRKRDKHCRFPRCGCRQTSSMMKAFPTVSHQEHKGMGGDPKGQRSIAELMILLCKWRHQDAPFSQHKQTLYAVFLTDEKFNGPIAWMINWGALSQKLLPAQERSPVVDDWRELARETAINVFEPFTDWQLEVLDELAGMEV